MEKNIMTGNKYRSKKFRSKLQMSWDLKNILFLFYNVKYIDIYIYIYLLNIYIYIYLI